MASLKCGGYGGVGSSESSASTAGTSCSSIATGIIRAARSESGGVSRNSAVQYTAEGVATSGGSSSNEVECLAVVLSGDAEDSRTSSSTVPGYLTAAGLSSGASLISSWSCASGQTGVRLEESLNIEEVSSLDCSETEGGQNDELVHG